MKRIVGVVALVGLSLGLAACATSNNDYASKTESYDTNRKVAQQATIEYTTDRRNFEPVCGQAPNTAVVFGGTQQVLTSRQEAVTRYSVSTPVYSCESNDGNGSGGDWGGFYDRPGDKAQQLNNAIKGVGKAVAPHLVPYFQQGKPRSWSSFSNVITNAAREIQAKTGINASWANGVLYQYKADNIRNLGYLGGTNCTIVRYDTQTYEDRQFIQDLSVVVEIRGSGAKLLPGECDKYSVSWNGREVSGGVTSDYNRYNVAVNYDALTASYSQGRKAVVTFTGQRAVVNPGYLIEIQGSTAVATGGGVQINVRNSALNQMMAVPEFANACKLHANVSISGRTGSAWSGKKTAVLKTASFPLDGTQGMTSYTASGVTMQDKQHPVVKISTAFASGCPFYNTSVVDNGTIEE